jgi:hypothetical protein
MKLNAWLEALTVHPGFEHSLVCGGELFAVYQRNGFRRIESCKLPSNSPVEEWADSLCDRIEAECRERRERVGT